MYSELLVGDGQDHCMGEVTALDDRQFLSVLMLCQYVMTNDTSPSSCCVSTGRSSIPFRPYAVSIREDNRFLSDFNLCRYLMIMSLAMPVR